MNGRKKIELALVMWHCMVPGFLLGIRKGVDANGESVVEVTQEEFDDLVEKLSSAPDPFVIEGPSEYNPRPFESDIPDDDRKSCPDCKGTGEYAGILVVENCQRCKGIGQI